MGGLLAIAVCFPLSIAWARRIWRRSPAAGPVALSPELGDRMGRIEDAVEAIAIEVERIGEGQRFVTRVLGSGTGGAEPLAVRAREIVEGRR